MLHYGDCLDIMRGMDAESIDLIATDPPFNTGRGFGAYNDRWEYTIDREREYWELGEDAQFVVDAAYRAHGAGMGAFLCFLAVRVLAMHRILKPTGSLYLHCDQTASHYIKLMLDAVFGVKNFRNEIKWKKTLGRKNNAKNKFFTQHESLFLYVKSEDAFFNKLYEPMSDAEIAKRYKFIDDNGDRYSEVWGRNWRKDVEKLGHVGRKYLKDSKGVAIGDLWVSDDLQLSTSSSEKVGYPTQKPVALYERIISASCPPDGLVLDPFAGSGTTLVAATKLGRQCIGIDNSRDAVAMSIARLQSIKTR